MMQEHVKAYIHTYTVYTMKSVKQFTWQILSVLITSKWHKHHTHGRVSQSFCRSQHPPNQSAQCSCLIPFHPATLIPLLLLTLPHNVFQELSHSHPSTFPTAPLTFLPTSNPEIQLGSVECCIYYGPSASWRKAQLPNGFLTTKSL